jgi:hypothetical protein
LFKVAKLCFIEVIGSLREKTICFMNYTLKLRLEGEFLLFNGSIHFNPIKY